MLEGSYCHIAMIEIIAFPSTVKDMRMYSVSNVSVILTTVMLHANV